MSRHEPGTEPITVAQPPTELAPAIPLEEVGRIAERVQELIAAGDPREAWQRLNQLHPADVGLILAGLPRTSSEALLQIMSPQTVTWMLQHMNPVEASRLGARLSIQTLSFVLDQVNPRHALTALQRLPIRRAQEVAEQLEQPIAESELLSQDPNTAGALMTDRFVAVDANADIADLRTALEALQEDRGRLTYLYVLNPQGLPDGQISMVDLALAPADAAAASVAAPLTAVVSADTPAQECARLRRHYNLTQLPVVEGNTLIGVVLPDALLGVTVEEDTRQMLQVANVPGERADGPMALSIRTRLPWLTINLATTFLAAATISLFESTLTQLVVLAAFLPVVAGQGGIGGTQTLTLIVRAIALGELVGIRAKRLLVREATLGVIHGIWLGLLVAAIAIIWQDNYGLALVLGIAMMGNMLIAGTVGAGVPLLMRRVGIDPAVASAVVVTTFTDVFGFLLFLGIAQAAISLLV
ncbi:MAG: magnesium transporter [Chloroflexi bacterium]|nr:magnesium transporter [Chloroflexota bacterium]